MSVWPVEVPRALEPILYPKRYKVAYGGRGGTKSWTFADALLAEGIRKSTRVLCAREVQKSIKESVYQLLKDRIKEKDDAGNYRILNNEIRSNVNDTVFTFTGLQSHTVASIKSFEGYDRCWVEEAHTVSKRSWDILIPTIRKPGSEIWVSFNPYLDTDDTYHRFITKTPPDCVLMPINWRDNPWWHLLPELEQERLHCKESDPDNYDNIWEGMCLPAVEGAIFYKEIELAQKEGRICNVPYDPMLKVQVICDLGNLKNMFLALVQRRAAECRFLYAMQGGFNSIPGYSSFLKNEFPNYNWGSWWLPHDGFTESRQTGKDDAAVLRAQGWHVPSRDEITEMGVEEGIRYAKMRFGQFYFDRTNANPIIEAAKRYRRRVDPNTGHEGSPFPDDYAHGGDTIRYTALNFDSFRNEKRVWNIPNTGGFRVQDPSVGY